jgi:hypothetical protein
MQVSTNRYQRRIRDISDAHMDATALGMDAVEHTRTTLSMTRRALVAGLLNTSEAMELLAAHVEAVRCSERSVAGSVTVERMLTAFSRELATLPPTTTARQAA